MIQIVEILGQTHEVILPTTGFRGVAVVNGVEVSFDAIPAVHPLIQYSLLLAGRPHEVELRSEEDLFCCSVDGTEFKISVSDERRKMLQRLVGQTTLKASTVGDIKAPMPGLVIKLEVVTGQWVEKGDGIVIIEAMKMENEIRTTIKGQVAELFVNAGQPVEKGQALVRIQSNS